MIAVKGMDHYSDRKLNIEKKVTNIDDICTILSPDHNI